MLNQKEQQILTGLIRHCKRQAEEFEDLMTGHGTNPEMFRWHLKQEMEKIALFEKVEKMLSANEIEVVEGIHEKINHKLDELLRR